ncbi:uncharacterized protein G2W53_010058 [Senna tora]|uniref:Uncharacterized protein n=1 Tax=Senna tora TaxID=362788 RepID=A0A835C960_9FABA|nr:uncharacterized protein G2W53_010058 [Senna tora]
MASRSIGNPSASNGRMGGVSGHV